MPDDVTSLRIRVLSEDVERAHARLKRLEDQGRDTEESVKRLGKSSEVSFGAIAAKVGGVLAVSSAVGASVRSWLEYDKAMKEVLSITNMNRAEFSAMREDVLRMSSAIGVDATVAAKGLYEAISAGIPKENAIEFMTVASKSAIAGLTDVNVAVNGLTNVINAYKLPASDAMTISDKLFAAVVDGKTTFDELSKEMSKASVIAASLDVPLEQLLASIISITKQGTPTAEAFTQMKAVLTAMVKPTDELTIAYQSMGVEGGRQAIAQFGLANALQMVRDRFAGNDAMLVKALSSTEAYNGVLSITGANLATFDQGLKNVNNSAGSTNKAFKDNADTLQVSFTGLKSAFIGFVETVENNLGILKTATGLLREMTEAMNVASQIKFQDINSMATMGGVGGAVQLKALISELEAKKGELEVRLQRARSTPSYGSSLTGGIGITAETTASADLTNLEQRLEKARTALSKFDEQTIKSAELQQNLIDAVNDKNPAAEANARAALDAREKELAIQKEQAEILSEVGELDALLQQQKVKMADEELKKQEELKTAKKKADEEELRRQERLKEEAKDLATTEREKLELKIKQLEVLKQQSPEEAATADKAIAAVRQQIEEYDKLQAKKAALPTGEGGGGASDALLPGIHELDKKTSDQLEEQYATEQNLLQNSLDNRLISEGEFQDRSKANWKKYQSSLIQLTTNGANVVQVKQLEMHQQVLSLASDISGQLTELAGEDSKRSKVMFAIAKSVAIAQAIVNTELAATRALAEGGFYLGIPMATVIRGLGYTSIGLMAGTALQKFEHGGMIGAGQTGIVGEAGPELVRGPAVVTSARATRGLIGSGDEKQPIKVIVNNLPGATAEVQERNDGGERVIEITIQKTIKRLKAEAENGGGTFVPALARHYGLTRKGN